MQSAFGTVVLVVCGVGVAGAIVALLAGRRTWEDYGRDHLLRDSDARGPAAPGSVAMAATEERDEEIRQMLEARNARRRSRGEPELDTDEELRRLTEPVVDDELGRLTEPAVDDELRAEIRDLVIARNHRRARQGKPALDVEAEVEREIAALGRL